MVTPTAAQLLALRHHVPDSALLDWLDLAQLLEPPCVIPTELLMQHWHCTQPNVSRRLGNLWHAGLIDYRAGRGRYTVRRLGPISTAEPPNRHNSDTGAPLIIEIRSSAADLPC